MLPYFLTRLNKVWNMQTYTYLQTITTNVMQILKWNISLIYIEAVFFNVCFEILLEPEHPNLTANCLAQPCEGWNVKTTVFTNQYHQCPVNSQVKHILDI